MNMDNGSATQLSLINKSQSFILFQNIDKNSQTLLAHK